MVVKVARQKAVDDEPPVERQRAPRRPHQLEDDSRAVRGDGIVPFGMFGERGRLDDIFRQQRARLGGRGVEPVEAHVLAAHVGAQSHRIALGGREIDERVVSEGVGDRREHAGLLAPDLDRPGDMVAVLEAETHDDMRHLGPGPIGEEQVERLQFGEVVGALLPTLGEVLVGPPVEIPHVGERQNVALDCSGRLSRDVRRPVAVERRRDRAPPDEQVRRRRLRRQQARRSCGSGA